MATNPVKLFISYAREDESFKEQLEKRLKPYVRNNTIDSWSDRAILPGTEWDDAVKDQMNAADVILFLVSSDFLASDYIHDIEIAKAMERYEAGLLRIVPIVVRPSDLSQLKIRKFQALPKDAKPITKWEDKDEAWLDVIKGLKRIFDSQLGPSDSKSSLAQKQEEKELPKEIKSKIIVLIKEDTNKALNKLEEVTKGEYPVIYHHVILISSRYKKLEEDKMKGIISNDQSSLERARINDDLLTLLSS